MTIVTGITLSNRVKPLLEVNSNTNIKQIAKIVEVDASGGNILITLATINNNTIKNEVMTFKRIDNSANTVTFVGTSGNFEDENLQIGMDPQLETFTTYASKANIWRTI